jgi:hypothetical protein
MKKRGQVWSLVGVVAMAAVLPGILKLANTAVRLMAGASGRLAAITVETDKILGPVPVVWTGLAQGGEGLATFLDGNEEVVAALKPEYIRVDHIFDQFGVVSRGAVGLQFDFSQLDRLVNKIRQVGAVPFLSLSYMPPAISSGDIVAAPNDWNEWSLVVQRTIEHYSGEMGIDSMYYEVWNEPDLFGKWKMGGEKDYKTLYYYASKGASAATGVKAFKFGGPGTTGLYPNWVNNFLPFVVQNKLRMDFFSWHRYDTNLEIYTEDVTKIDQWLEKHPYFSNVEKVVTEMAPQSEAGGVNDTNLGAAHLVAVSRDFMGKVKKMMTFSVSGRWGVINRPRYEALTLLGSMGPDRLSVTGEGSWVRAIATKNSDRLQVLLTNYDPEGKHSEVVPVNLINMPGQNYTIRTTVLGVGTVSETASNSGLVQKLVSMPANSVVMLELNQQ